MSLQRDIQEGPERREGVSRTVICGTNFPGRHKINSKAECGLEVLGRSFRKLHSLSSVDTASPGTDRPEATAPGKFQEQ